jgi:hypothetical protein
MGYVFFLSAPLGKLECKLNSHHEVTANEIIANIVAWLVQEMGAWDFLQRS